ncbi:MAG: ATP-binding cassette domain-containing protein, partial [Acidimicrobiales bacterium]
PQQSDKGKLASMMVGRSVVLVVQKQKAKPGSVTLEVKDLVVEDSRGLTVVDHMGFEVRAGEILALAGVQGNGQTEVVRALTGLMPIASGSVVFAGHDVAKESVKERLREGIAHVPEDRQRDGLILQMSIADNLVLDVYDVPPHAHHGARDLAEVRRNGAEKLVDFDIRAKSAEEVVSTLSGGNQQKVIVARELSRETKLLIASQPTRGLDVGSIEYVHKRIVEERDRGTAVLLISSELDEVLALGDRIAVVYRGKITGVVDPTVGREKIGLLMAGVTEEEQTEPVAVASGVSE